MHLLTGVNILRPGVRGLKTSNAIANTTLALYNAEKAMFPGKALFIGLAILVVLVATGIFAARLHSPPPEQTNPTALSTSTTIVSQILQTTTTLNERAKESGWSTYTNTKYGYSIQCPPEWGCDRMNSKVALMLMHEGPPPFGGGLGTEIMVTATAMPSALKIKPSETQLLRTYFGTFSDPNFRDFVVRPLSMRNVALDTYPAIEREERFIPRGRESGHNIVELATYITNGTFIYRLSVDAYYEASSSGSTTPLTDLNLYRRVISTFRMLPRAGDAASQ